MLPKKPHTAADVERGVRASPNSIPVVCAQWLAAVYTCRFRHFHSLVITVFGVVASAGNNDSRKPGRVKNPGAGYT